MLISSQWLSASYHEYFLISYLSSIIHIINTKIFSSRFMYVNSMCVGSSWFFFSALKEKLKKVTSNVERKQWAARLEIRLFLIARKSCRDQMSHMRRELFYSIRAWSFVGFSFFFRWIYCWSLLCSNDFMVVGRVFALLWHTGVLLLLVEKKFKLYEFWMEFC